MKVPERSAGMFLIRSIFALRLFQHKNQDMERSGTFRNIPERSGTFQNVPEDLQSIVIGRFVNNNEIYRTFWNAKERSGTFRIIKNDLNSPCLHTKTRISKERSKTIQNVLERTRTFFFIVFLWNVLNHLYLKSLVMTQMSANTVHTSSGYPLVSVFASCSQGFGPCRLTP